MRTTLRDRSLGLIAITTAVSMLAVSCGSSPDTGSTADDATGSADEIVVEGAEEEYNTPQEPDSFGNGAVLEEEDAGAIDNSPITASISVESQSLTQGGINIESAGVPETGWVVLHADGPEGEVLGYEQLFGPLNPSITIEVGDGVAAGSQLWAGVYQDMGEADTFEPGIDQPFSEGSEPVGTAFTVEEPVE